MLLEHHFISFLGFNRRVDWSRVGEYAAASELEMIARMGCKCGVSPMALCPVHRCRCRNCGISGIECAWRTTLSDFIQQQNLIQAVKNGEQTLTYLQVFEIDGFKAPQNPRIRIQMNILVLKLDTRPLNDILH